MCLDSKGYEDLGIAKPKMTNDQNRLGPFSFGERELLEPLFHSLVTFFSLKAFCLLSLAVPIQGSGYLLVQQATPKC